MACGLFGKLPSKRDFVSNGAPRRFLDVYEAWLQAGIASSRHSMGPAWQDAYLRMPIWRFWLGAGHCGATAMGAFMPSVDGVGRYFPMTVFAVAGGADAYLPPELDPAESWFEAAEAALLDALDPQAPYERFAAAVAALHEPLATLNASRPEGLHRRASGAIAIVDPSPPLTDAFAAARVEGHALHYRSMCCLWTSGGEDFPPMLLVDGKLPDPALFAGLITGDITGAPAEAPAFAGGIR
jgi:type VI secretion system protein ImpM